ncbi:peptidyl-tRNA hydrolase ICT1, mitochondrial [Notolabrus celidotus]|uniref:peptidyl-tRNA hydrolase ICT1, mitochondrial n=1 Tax=Notolabrus celidotus TaxID=1203425 RepID=UPI0014901B20|nr:peptidyl-tRNA hydrolase ICT1, mitochondrial [Notolabrus celidotus]
MAAHIVRGSCLLLRAVMFPQNVKLRGVFIKDKNNTLQPTLSYGTRGRDDTQGDQVHIPVERLTVSYSRSSGPGGQHVNKVSTKAEIRFHVLTAEWIPEDVRRNIFETNKNRINKAGELLVTSELSRSQQRNLADCVQKISAIVAEASEKPHEPTAEDLALRAARLEKRNKERLRQKKIQSAIKQSRRLDFD